MTLLLLAPFVALTVLGLRRDAVPAELALAEAAPTGLTAGILIAMWNYMGWDNASTIAGEVDRPRHTYPLAMLGALLGVSFDPAACRIAFQRPMLPPWLETLRLANLRLGTASVDVLLERRGDGVALHKLRRDGEIEVVLTI